MVESRRQMLFVPEIEAESFFFFYFEGTTGRSYSVRTYHSPNQAPTVRRPADFSHTAQDILRMAKHQVKAAPHAVEDSAHWYELTRALNEQHLGKPAAAQTIRRPSAPAPVSGAAVAPPRSMDGGRFYSSSGMALQTIDDWRAQHPAAHWREGYSAMELARCWSSARGMAASFRTALSASPLRDLTIERGVVEHETAVPGKGRASCTDLMLFARGPGGLPVVIGVEGKVDESFSDFVGDWLEKADTDDHRANRELRLEGLCEALQFRPAEVRGLRYQLLHRAYATVSTARTAGAGQAMLAIHSLGGRGPVGGNWEDFRTFARMLGCSDIVAGRPARVGQRHGVELWLLWVTEAA